MKTDHIIKSDKMVKTEPKLIRLVCKKCGKIIASVSPKQAEHNMAVHLMTHRKPKGE